MSTASVRVRRSTVPSEPDAGCDLCFSAFAFSTGARYSFRGIMRSRALQHGWWLALVILSFCVMMQALGTPITLWDPIAPDQDDHWSLSEGFSIPSSVVRVSPQLTCLIVRDPSLRLVVPPFTDTPFRPPALL